MKVKIVLFLVTVMVIFSGINKCYPFFFSHKDAIHPLRKAATIDLPGRVGKRFDYMAIDYNHNYLLSAHSGDDVLHVIDMKTNKHLKTITNTPGIEGVEYVAELNKAYASNGQDHSIGVIDMNTMKVIKKISAINKPAGSVYAPEFKKLYVSDETGKTLIVVDVTKDEVVKKIVFKSETGMPQYDPVAQKIYLNLQDANAFVVIDPQTDKMTNVYAVGNCKGNHGMALDVVNHLAFLVCENSDTLTVFNLNSHKPVAYVDITQGGGVVKYDPGLKRIYVACSGGAISVIHEDNPTHFTKLDDFHVQKKVHSLAVDTVTHKVYAPEQEEDEVPVSRMVVYDAVLSK